MRPCCPTLVWTAVAFGSPPRERTEDVRPIRACAPLTAMFWRAAHEDTYFSEVLAASLLLATVNICTSHCVLGNDAKVFH